MKAKLKMKKFLLYFLIACTLLSLAACSSEPVPFSDKLGNKRACYIDVVEITPQSSIEDLSFLCCRCKLEDGSTVWMEILGSDYVKYFDSEAFEEDISYTARQIVYDKPVRLDGKVAKVKNIFDEGENSSKKVKVFRFNSADEAETQNSAAKNSVAVEYDASLKNNTVIYTDIVRIEPKRTIAAFSTYNVTHTMCECTTTADETLWLYISIDDYHAFFDASARFSTSVIDPSEFSAVEFVDGVRVFGLTANKTDKRFAFLQRTSVSDRFIEFKDADKIQIDNAKLSNQAPVKYTGSEKEEQKVYMDITHITPEFVWYTGYTVPTGLICRCKTTDNEDVWMTIGIANFKTNFFADYEDAMGVEKSLPGSVRVVGRIKSAQSVSWDLSDKIQQDTIIGFLEVTNP